MSILSVQAQDLIIQIPILLKLTQTALLRLTPILKYMAMVRMLKSE